MLYQKRASRFNFTKALMLGGVCTAILTGCNQSPNDNPDTIDGAAGGVDGGPAAGIARCRRGADDFAAGDVRLPRAVAS